MILPSKGNIKTAMKSLRRNKARSLLTMLGVVIGIVSVVMVVGIGEGVKRQVSVQTEHLGKDLITIRPGQLLTQSAFDVLRNAGTANGLNAHGSLSDNDLHTIFGTPGLGGAVPLSLINGSGVSAAHGRHYGAFIIGTNEQLPPILNQSLAFGAFFNDDPTSRDKVVIGSHVARALYDQNVPLGQTLTILDHQFVVVGIFSDFQTAPLSVDADFNNAVFIPYTTALAITNNNSPLYEILARPERVSQTHTVARGLNSRLLAAHGGQHDFTVLEQSQTMTVTDNILNLLTAAISGVASVSLLVGGIGIMNVMLVSITERMQEIGIRKAVGATNRQILGQFVTEAAILSLVGGLLGVTLSFLTEVVLRLFTHLAPVITWQVVTIACLVSVGVGVLFGSVPALKAARKDPIAALRNE